MRRLRISEISWASIGRMQFDLRNLDAPRFRRFFRTIRRDLSELIEEGQAHGEIDAELDAELTAATIIGAIDGLLLQKLVDASAFPDALALSATLRLAIRKGLTP